MAAQNLALDNFWIDGSKYSEAEKTFYERLGHEALTPLAAEFAKARERIREMKRQVDEAASVGECINIGLPIEQDTNIVVEPNQVTESCKQQSSQTLEQIVLTSTNITQTEDLPLEKSKAVEKSSEFKDAVADEIDLPIIAENSKDKVLNPEVFVKPVEETSCRNETVMAIPPEKEATPLQTPVLSDLVCDKQETPIMPCQMASFDAGAVKFLEKKVKSFSDVLEKVQQQLAAMDLRLSSIEKSIGKVPTSAPYIAVCPAKPSAACAKPPPAEPAPKKADEEDDDVDLFGSDSEDDEEANKVKEARLAEYNAKKSKKPALVAKSSIILDVKPWDDETDMKAMEVEVRKIACDGLLWGASKLVPLAYGIRKLQINCVVEDDKVSIDWLQEQIEANEDFVQSVDIAAFNKI